MSEPDDFLKQGFEQVRLELTDIVGGAGLHLKPETLGRGLAARARARLKALEVILRRLVLLLAMTLQPAPAKPRAVRALMPVPEGVEDVTNSFSAAAKTRSIALFGPSGRVPGALPEDAARKSETGPASAAPLLAHVAALYRVLRAPEAMALRMARRIEYMKAGRECRPVCLAQPDRHRMRPELALVSALLPDLVRTALDPWPDTS